MMLLEHDAKALLAARGLPVPAGLWLDTATGRDAAAARVARIAGPPWVVKAQIPAGGRGKAGGIRMAASADEAAAQVEALCGARLRGFAVRGCRVEEAVRGARELYFALIVDPAQAAVRILLAEQGGVDIESNHAIRTHEAAPTPAAVATGIAQLAGPEGAALAPRVQALLQELGAAFFALEATLLEINPLFLLHDGTLLLGDVKLVADANSFARQPELAALVRAHPDRYPEAACKLLNGFDYVVLDPDGEIALLTSGAGLAMQLVDELAAQGGRTYNFLDLRGGQMRGDPTRLVQVFGWFAAAPGVRVILMNLFAGLTNMADFARLFLKALEQVPQLQVPIVARLDGLAADEARTVFETVPSIVFEPDLDRAIERAIAIARGDGHGR